MELNLPDGYTLISTKELHAIKKIAQEYVKFRNIYFRYNKELNKLFKLADIIVNPLKGGANDRKDIGVSKEKPGGDTKPGGGGVTVSRKHSITYIHTKG